MRVGSLFAGVGGFDLAAERAGMEVLWQSENDANASVVLEHHWPNLNLGDIHDIRIRRHEPGVESGGVPIAADREGLGGLHPTDHGGANDGNERASAVDVLVGGFPCQDYSVAGNRRGLVGDRGALWWQFLRLITEGRPTWVVGENVPGLLSSRNGQDFATIIDSLTELGYGVVWGVLDAQWFGVAQRRRRVFIVAHSGGRPRPEILALSESLFGHPEPSRETGQGIASCLKTVPTPSRLRAEEGHLIAFAQNQRDEVRDLNNLAGSLSADEGMKQRTYLAVHPTLAASPSGPGGQDEEIHHMVLSPTVRRLTPLECQRLQGFPDDWYDGIEMSDAQKYRQMGNAVAVPVAEWIMKRIAAYEPEEKL